MQYRYTLQYENSTEGNNAFLNTANWQEMDVCAMVSITYAALKSLRDNGNLVAGKTYRITDYVTTTVQANTRSAGHVFDIIVVADAPDKLNENARAVQHAGDTYFSESKLEAWRLKYRLDNDITRFKWADSSNGKGVIYWMKDEFENECPYDFKNIIYDSGVTGFVWDFGGFEAVYSRDPSKDGSGFYGFSLSSGDGLPLFQTKTLDVTTSTPVYYQGSLFDYGYMKSVMKILSFTFSQENTDASRNIGAYTDVKNNCIKPCYSSERTLKLNFIYFCTSGSLHCNGNTFGNGCSNNSFGNNCYNNTFGSSCSGNTFGDNCSNNSFDDGCGNNSFGNNCYNNTFGDGNEYNKFGDSCYRNIFGNECSGNTFGSSCSGNTFGSYCGSNTLGNGCRYNSFGNSCGGNTFGNNCAACEFKNGCDSNTLGDGCLHIRFLKNWTEYNIVENGNFYIDVTSTQTTSSSNQLRNIKIAQGVNNGEGTTITISHNTLMDTFQTTYQATGSTIVNI